jgi:hypothetical protein
LKAAKEKVRELFGELFEGEPVAVISRLRPRVVSARVPDHRNQRSAKVAM